MVTGREATQRVRTSLIEDLQYLPADVDDSPDTDHYLILQRELRRIEAELGIKNSALLFQAMKRVITLMGFRVV